MTIYKTVCLHIALMCVKRSILPQVMYVEIVWDQIVENMRPKWEKIKGTGGYCKISNCIVCKFHTILARWIKGKWDCRGMYHAWKMRRMHKILVGLLEWKTRFMGCIIYLLFIMLFIPFIYIYGVSFNVLMLDYYSLTLFYFG